MKTTTELKEFAQLAQASYAILNSSAIYGSDSATQAALEASPNGAFAQGQANDFTNRYRVLNQFRDFDTIANGGFSATLFQDKDNPNRLVLSFAGTEFETDLMRDLLITDAQIGTVGYAMPQALALYRYVRQLQTGAGMNVSYSISEIQKLYLLDGRGFGSSLPNTSDPQFTAFRDALQVDIGIDAGQGTGIAVLGIGGEIDLAGHSLGGHLAILAQRLFSNTFDDVITVNAATFYAAPFAFVGSPNWLISETTLSYFGEWDSTKILRMESVGDGVSEIAQIYPGTTLTVGMETRFGPLDSIGANHSVANVADGLALTELLGKLDSRYLNDARFVKSLFDAGSNLPGASYENLLDAIRKVILGTAQPPTTVDDPAAGRLNLTRKSLYENLHALAASTSFRSLMGKVTIELCTDADLAVQANTDFSAFLSLHTLSPIILKTDATGQAILKQTHAALAQQWEADQSLSSEQRDAGLENFTSTHLLDRQALLQYRIVANIKDAVANPDGYLAIQGTRPTANNLRFIDIGSTTMLQVDTSRPSPSTAPNQYVIFGNDSANTINGSAQGDRLYGGDGNDGVNGSGGEDYLEGNAGNDAMDGGKGIDTLLGGAGDDTLTGGEASDFLFGGAGNDTYYFEGNVGIDIVQDGDGVGKIVVGAPGFEALSGGNKLAENVWISDDKKFTYALIEGNLVIRPGENSGATGILTVQGWKAGDLGITLSNTPAPSVTPAAALTGDFKKKQNPDGTQYLIGADGNYIPDGSAPAAPDLITGGNAAELIQGLAGDDALLGRDGDDVIDGGDGGDVLMGGPGADTLRGGAGHDYIAGSSNGSLVYTIPVSNGGGDGGYTPAPVMYGTGVSWFLYPNGTDEDGYPIVWLTTTVGRDQQPGDKGNLIDGGTGDDGIFAGSGSDVVHAGAGQDQVAGMAGADMLFGDDGQDRIYGDGSAANSGETVLYTPAAQHGHDVLYGGQGNDLLLGQGSDDVLYGGEGNDTLYGDDRSAASTPETVHGDDYLDGGDGADTLFGNRGQDILIGGKGDDRLEGGDGKDIYIFNKGDGKDTVIDALAGANVFRFGQGVSKDDIKLRLGSLLLDLGEGDEVHIAGFDPADAANSVVIDSFEFADGSVLTAGDLLARGFDIDGTEGADVLVGTSVTDRIRGGDGDDTLLGSDGDDVLEGGNGNDLLVADGGNDSLLDGAGFNQYLIRTSTADVTVWASRNDVVSFGAGASLEGASATVQGGAVCVGLSGGGTVTVEGDALFVVDRTLLTGAGLVDLLASRAEGPSSDEPTGQPGQTMRWVDVQGGLHSETYVVDGSEEIIYQPDGGYTRVETNQNGQVEAKYFTWDDKLTGSSIRQTQGYNSITSYRDAAGVKTSETWVHADGTTGADPVGPDQLSFNGMQNVALFSAARDVGDTVFEWETPGYDQGTWPGAWGRVWGSDTDDHVGVDHFGVNWQVRGLDIGGRAYVDGAHDFYLGNDGSLLLGYSNLWAGDFSFEAYYAPGDFGRNTLAEYYVGGVSVSLRAEALRNGQKTIYAVDFSNGQWMDVPLASSDSLQTPTKVTYRNSYGHADLVEDGQGNAIFTSYGAAGEPRGLIWFHNDGSNGVIAYMPDGSTQGVTSNPQGTLFSFVQGPDGEVEFAGHPGAEAAWRERVVEAPAVTPRPAPPSLGSAPWSDYQHAPYSRSIPDGHGGWIQLDYSWAGTVNKTYLDTDGNIVSKDYVDTDPGYGASVVLAGSSRGWHYDFAGVPLCRYVRTADGALQTYTYDAQGRLTGAQLARTANGTVTTARFNAAGVALGSSVQAPTVAGRTDTAHYDALGALSGKTVKVDDGKGNSVSCDYDASGALQIFTTTVATGPRETTITTYNAAGAATGIWLTSLSEDGLIQSHNYDAGGALIGSVLAQVADNGTTTTGFYGADGTLQSYVVMASDALHNTLITTYDSQGRKTLDDRLQADGIHASTAYDMDGSRVTTTTQLDGSYSTLAVDKEGDEVLTQYSAGGAKLSDTWRRGDGTSGTHTYSPDGSWTARTIYADGSSSTTQTDAAGNSRALHWSASGVATGAVVTTRTASEVRTVFFNAQGTVLNEITTQLGIAGTPITVNQRPRLLQEFGAHVAAEDSPWAFSIAADAFVDADAGDTLTYSARLGNGNALPSWLNFDPATLTFSGIPGNGDIGTLQVRVTAIDTAGAAVSDTFDLRVENANDAPTVVSTIAPMVVMEDQYYWRFYVLAESFADVDKGDRLTFSARLADGSALPSWLNFDARALKLSGMPSNADVGSLDVAVVATDIAGASASLVFKLVVGNTNDAPVAGASLATQQANTAEPFHLQLPGTLITDIDKGDVLTWDVRQASGSPLPAWLSFDAATCTLSGLPGTTDIGLLSLRVTATDKAGASASVSLALNVTLNPRPALVQPLENQHAIEDQPWLFTIPAGSFAAVNAPDVLTYSVTLSNGEPLPAWLEFDSSTRTLRGTATNSNVGSLSLKVAATDSHGLSTSDEFDLSVANMNDAPVASSTLPDWSLSSGSAARYTVSADSFADEDIGDTLSFAATLADGAALPAWLHFNAATLTFSGTPASADAGSAALRVVATDSAGASADSAFVMTVAKVDIGSNLLGTTANDTLTGGPGNDFLNGLAGADRMIGHQGDDTYTVDTARDVVTELPDEGIDTVNSPITYTLPTHVENLVLTGSANRKGTGNASDNNLIGNTGRNTLTGADGNDTLDGGAGKDVLIGGTGNDTYLMARGGGADKIKENDATPGNTDVALFGPDITADQLWFQHRGRDLQVTVIGTSDKFTVSNWFAGTPYHVEQFKTSDGKTLLDSQVQKLVDAMAGFAPPAAGQTTLSTGYQSQLGGIIAANWQ
jgi:Ca2+-binding RTX toxin-like protein